MSTLTEIEEAARRLPLEDRQRLLLWLASTLRSEIKDLPEPRRFSPATLQRWIDEDERDFVEFRRKA
jgi:hypothetical protein